jgi:uncharacterized protein (DUF2342 family)
MWGCDGDQGYERGSGLQTGFRGSTDKHMCRWLGNHLLEMQMQRSAQGMGRRGRREGITPEANVWDDPEALCDVCLA